MLEGKPLFPGKDHVNQFSIITELLGTPPDDVIQTICSENVCIKPPTSLFGTLANHDVKQQTLRFVKSLPKRERQPLATKFRNADADGMCTTIG
jgi:p38 MAP kinase